MEQMNPRRWSDMVGGYVKLEKRIGDGGDVVEGCGGDAGGCGAKGEQEGEW